MLEAVLDGELTDHLGYERHDPAGHGADVSKEMMTRIA